MPSISDHLQITILIPLIFFIPHLPYKKVQSTRFLLKFVRLQLLIYENIHKIKILIIICYSFLRLFIRSTWGAKARKGSRIRWTSSTRYFRYWLWVRLKNALRCWKRAKKKIWNSKSMCREILFFTTLLRKTISGLSSTWWRDAHRLSR